MYCIYCGSDNPDDAVFCRGCGKRQVLLEDQSEPSSSVISSSVLSTAPGMAAGTASVKQESITASSIHGSSTQSNELRFSQDTAFSVPAASPSVSGSSIGLIIASLGGIVALLAFFFMPYVSYGYFSFTGQQLASFGSQANNGSGQLNEQLSQLQVLWLEPVIAGIVVILAGYLLYKNLMNTVSLSSGRGGAISLAVIGGLSFVILLIVFAANSQPMQSAYGYSQPALASIISSGFWVYAVAMLAVAMGGVISAAQTKSSL